MLLMHIPGIAHLPLKNKWAFSKPPVQEAACLSPAQQLEVDTKGKAKWLLCHPQFHSTEVVRQIFTILPEVSFDFVLFNVLHPLQ